MPQRRANELAAPVTTETRAYIASFCESVSALHGHSVLSDHLMLDLLDVGCDPPPIAALGGVEGDTSVVALASQSNEGWVIEVVANNDHDLAPPRTVTSEIVSAVIGALRREGVPKVTWWIRDHDRWAESVAQGIGFTEDRRLLQMRMRLDGTVRQRFRDDGAHTRDFDEIRDIEPWLTLNNAAFSDHDEQGGWTRESLERRLHASWFKAEDFRVHERSRGESDGDTREMAGFCWTKRHEPNSHQPAMGEIYVIAVAPDLAGRGLGRQLAMSGFAHLADQGLQIGMLYVDSDNEAALSMYESLGLTVHHTDRAYVMNLEYTSAD